MIRNVAYNYRTLKEWTIDNQSDYRNFTIYAAQMMLIGCLEREYLKKGLIFDVNSSTKSDLIGGINFSMHQKVSNQGFQTDTAKHSDSRQLCKLDFPCYFKGSVSRQCMQHGTVS